MSAVSVLLLALAAHVALVVTLFAMSLPLVAGHLADVARRGTPDGFIVTLGIALSPSVAAVLILVGLAVWGLGHPLALVLTDVLVFAVFQIPLAMFIMVSDLPFLAYTLGACCVVLALADYGLTSTVASEAPAWATGEPGDAT